ncbi:hypothetical protein COO60DRAFT_607850 [Scenedesmus sp. NREL 46B-D3]|nr:hypothetical protein COO60DRAFT_607850 [Scenedesmus sp. NREL 46B-D3]
MTFGQAFMQHELHRQLSTRLGREQHLFSGISRLMLDSFPDDPVLYVTEQGPADAAAVVFSSTQEAQMIAMQKTLDFSVTPGTLQLLQAVPESSLPLVMAAARQLHQAGTVAMQEAGHKSYLKLMLLAARPEAQGSGLGSAVLEAVVAAADRQQMPLYVEAAHDGLVPLYERYAFKPRGKLDSMTLMVRDRSGL